MLNGAALAGADDTDSRSATGRANSTDASTTESSIDTERSGAPLVSQHRNHTEQTAPDDENAAAPDSNEPARGVENGKAQQDSESLDGDFTDDLVVDEEEATTGQAPVETSATSHVELAPDGFDDAAANSSTPARHETESSAQSGPDGVVDTESTANRVDSREAGSSPFVDNGNAIPTAAKVSEALPDDADTGQVQATATGQPSDIAPNRSATPSPQLPPTPPLSVATSMYADDGTAEAHTTEAPVTLRSIVTDVLTWIGLGPAAANIPVPALPVPTFIEALWVAVRQNMYTWNNQRPVARTTISGQDPHTGVFTGKIDTIDYENDPITYLVSTDPAHGSIVIDTDGSFTYTPDPAYAATGGGDRFVVTVDDRIGNPPHTYGLLGALGLLGPTTTAVKLSIAPVTPPNRSPEFGTPAFDYTVDATTGVVTGTIKVTDPDGDDLNFHLDTTIDPAQGIVAIDEQTGAFTYTPTGAAREAAYATAGPDTLPFTVTVSDGDLSISIDITAPISERPPASTDPSVHIVYVDPETGRTTGVITTTGTSTPWTYSISEPSPYGAAAIDSTTGEWSFTPSIYGLVAAWAGATPSSATFTVAATDGVERTALEVTVPLHVTQDALIELVERHGSTPSAIAVSADGTVYVTNAGANTLSILTPTDVVTVSVGRTPQAVQTDPTGRVWVVNTGDDTVSVLSSTGAPLSAPIAVGDTPVGLAVGGDGSVYVANAAGNSVTVISPVTLTVTRTITVGSTPSGIAASADGRIWLANYGDGTLSVIDPADQHAITTLELDDIQPYGIAIRDDGIVAVTDPVAGSVTALTPEGATVYTWELSDEQDRITPAAIIAGPDGTFYVANAFGDTVVALAMNNGAITTIDVGGEPSGLALGAGGMLYVSNGGSDTVTAVDLDAASSESIPVGVDTSTVTVGANGELLVVSTYDNTLTVVPNTADVTTQWATSTWVNSPPYALLGTAMTVAADGLVYVSTCGNASCEVRQYSPGGEDLGWVAAFPNHPTTGVIDLVVTPDGDIYELTSRGFFVRRAEASRSQWEIVESPVIDGLQAGRMYSLTAGADGKLYGAAEGYAIDGEASTQLATGLLAVIDPASAEIVELITLAHAVDRNTVVFSAPDGTILVAAGLTVDVVDPSRATAVSHAVDQPLRSVAFDSTGRMYIPNANGSEVRVLNSDFTVAAVIPVGMATLEAVAGPEGKIFLSGYGPTVIVLDPADYSLSSVQLNGFQGLPVGGAGMIGGADAVYALAWSTHSGSIFTSMNRLSVYTPPPPPPPPTPVDPDPTTPWPAIAEGPKTVEDLWNNVWNKTNDDNQGIYTQTVRSSDGTVRLIVYIGGSNELLFGNQGWLENLLVELPVAPGQNGTKPDQIAAIDRAIEECNADCGGIDEIMLVGYSQGGMDAQRLADWNHFESNGSPVKIDTIVSFGSPIITNPDVTTLHIQDYLDEIVDLEGIGRFAALLAPISPVIKALLVTPSLSALTKVQIFKGRAETSFSFNPFVSWVPETVHGNPDTYRTLGQKFDDTPDYEFSSQKLALNSYLGGEIIATSDYVHGAELHVGL